MAYAIEDACEELTSAKDLDAVFLAARDKIRNLGFDDCSYLMVRPSEGPRVPTVLTSYPKDWISRYTDSNYVNIDPVVPVAAKRLSPFKWESLARGKNGSGFQKQLFDEASEFGLRAGCTVPLHGPGNSLAIFSVASKAKSRTFDRLWRRSWFDLMLMGILSHERIINLTCAPNRAGQYNLAPRERECLLWTARGKTAWEASRILGLAELTVVSYLKSAAKRLAVHSKTHAVAKAIMLGLIVP